MSSNPSPATWTVRAPGRVNIIGEHIDYNDGWVLPMAIARDVTIRAEARPERRLVFRSRQLDGVLTLDGTGAPLGDGPRWGAYVEGVVREFPAPIDLGFDAEIDSTVPGGGGLSSSAALSVAVATLLEEVTGHVLDPVEKALLCQRVEHEYAGVPCGIMDQMASVCCKAGALLLLDCVSREMRHIPFGGGEVAVLVTNSGVSHALADGAYAARRAQCAEVLVRSGLPSWRAMTPAHLEALRPVLDDLHYRRARHVVSEIGRTLAVAEALPRGAWDEVGTALYASHDSLAHDYEVSCPELDTLVEAARAIGREGGVIGARMTGGGFGGCTVTLVEAARAESVKAAIQRSFNEAFGRVPDSFVTAAAPGAGPVRSESFSPRG